MTSKPPRDRKRAATLLAALAVLLVAGLVLRSWPAEAAERLPGTETPELTAASAPELPVEPTPIDSAPLAAPAPGTDPALSREAEGDGLVGSGTIRGLVQVSAALRPQVARATIVLEEAVNEGKATLHPAPTVQRRMHAVDFPAGENRAFFELLDVPFSPYGWRVTPRVPGCNGSESVVVLRPESPDAQVQLEITPGIPVSITVIDQHRQAIEGLPVEMRPDGRPLGRGIRTGATDAYGLVVFADVLAGAYQLRIGSKLDPALPERKIEIAAQGHHFEKVELPRGGRFEARLVGEFGIGVEGVTVELIRVDSKVYRKYVGESDRVGDAVLHHVPPGRYYAHFTKKGYERLFREVTVQSGENTREQYLLKRSR